MERETTTHVAEELHPHGGDWLREIVFGLNDGLVTTLVFIMAVSAITAGHVVLVALSELLAGGVSMGLGGYLAARTANQVLDHRIATEHYEITHEPEEERAELRAIYRGKGLHGDLLDRVVDQLTADKDRWLAAMVRDELGVVAHEAEQPWLQGALVGGSFMLGALIPIVPFLTGLPWPQAWAYGLTALAALGLGAIKSRYTVTTALYNSLELLGLVTLGTVAGVAIGLVLHPA